MPYADPDKARTARRESSRRRRQKLRDLRFGPNAPDMRGRHGNHARGERNVNWRGGRFVTSHGYVAVRVQPDHPHAWGASTTCRYAYEHIVVAEAKLGRPLRDDEIVHHENGNRSDNRPENLTAMSRADHAREHSAERGRDELGRFPPEDLRVRQWPEVRR